MSKAEDLNHIYSNYQSTVLREGRYQNPYVSELLNEEDYDAAKDRKLVGGGITDTISDYAKGLDFKYMVRIETESLEQAETIADAVRGEFEVSSREDAKGDDYWNKWCNAEQVGDKLSLGPISYQVQVYYPEKIQEILDYVQTNFGDSIVRVKN